MTQSVYEELQQRLDKYSLGFPQTPSGIEIKILKRLFSEEDAALFLSLTPLLETPQNIAERLQQPLEEVSSHLEDMARRGLLFRLQKGDRTRYGAVPFMHGIIEFQVNRMDRDLAESMEQYYHDGMHKAIAASADLFLRTVPIGASLEVKHQVAAFDDACEILRGAKKIVVADCICRKATALLEKDCGKPIEVCFMFNAMAQYYLDQGMGREVDASEAIQILENAQRAGLVTQPATARNPAGMCSCCGDCCGVLRSINQHPKPAEIVFSNYFAAVDAAACSGCETCLDRCQMRALSMTADSVACIAADRCIGCGLCVVTCPTGALQLQPKPAEQLRTPPATGTDQMLTMAAKRGISF